MIRPVSGKHLVRAPLPSLEPSITSDNSILEPQKVNILDSTQAILALTPTREHVLPVMDTATKRLNSNSFLTPISPVIFVKEKDIKTKFSKSNGNEKA
ncbi:TPA: hypothetical protein DIC40_05870 [Patescibacteria group bacterium]|nr:hypothetical protein [Candidatus Gracilibacteria bacterium]